jgi:hypothetical protein
MRYVADLFEPFMTSFFEPIPLFDLFPTKRRSYNETHSCALLLTSLSLGLGFAQDRPHRVVFDLTSRDSLDQESLLRWVTGYLQKTPRRS